MASMSSREGVMTFFSTPVTSGHLAPLKNHHVEPGKLVKQHICTLRLHEGGCGISCALIGAMSCMT